MRDDLKESDMNSFSNALSSSSRCYYAGIRVIRGYEASSSLFKDVVVGLPATFNGCCFVCAR